MLYKEYAYVIHNMDIIYTLGQLQDVHPKLILTKFHSKNFNGFFNDYRGHDR